MIYVTLGTQDKSFKRILDAIEKELKIKHIIDQVIVQAGHTKYSSKHMQIFDFISNEENLMYIKNADVVITHAGVATIMECIRLKKPAIVVPRLKRYMEHTNDHQLEILKHFEEAGSIIALYNLDHLNLALEKARSFKPKPYISNTTNFVKLVNSHINPLK